MATHEAAQSVPRPFTGVIAPELPVGSPERAELFRQFRRTFVEDWKEAEEAVRQERIKSKGDLYFIRCGDAVKIGHTTDIVRRLANMQVNSPHEIDCVLLLIGKGHLERDWHRRFKHLRIRGEWFRYAPELETAVLAAREVNRAAP